MSIEECAQAIIDMTNDEPMPFPLSVDIQAEALKIMDEIGCIPRSEQSEDQPK